MERSSRRLHTKDAQISLAELPFIRLRDKIPLDGKGFKELVKEGQREIDIASIQPSVRVNLSEKVIYIGHVGYRYGPDADGSLCESVETKIGRMPFP